MSATDVASALRGISAIVHAVSAPDYRSGNTPVLPMFDNTIAASMEHSLRIVLSGTLPNFGPNALPSLS